MDDGLKFGYAFYGRRPRPIVVEASVNGKPAQATLERQDGSPVDDEQEMQLLYFVERKPHAPNSH